MIDYLIRTDKNERVTNIVKIGKPTQTLAIIYTDFQLYSGIRDIKSEDIVGPKQKTFAKIHLFKDEEVFSVVKQTITGSSKISSIDMNERYFNKGTNIEYSLLSKNEILQKQEYSNLKHAGVKKAYFMNENCDISKVLCYEKDGEISGLVSSEIDDIEIPLKALPLVFAQRIIDQKYLFKFMEKTNN